MNGEVRFVLVLDVHAVFIGELKLQKMFRGWGPSILHTIFMKIIKC